HAGALAQPTTRISVTADRLRGLKRLGGLAAYVREGPPDHCLLAGCVGQAITGLELHGEDATIGSRCRIVRLLTLRPSHRPHAIYESLRGSPRCSHSHASTLHD